MASRSIAKTLKLCHASRGLRPGEPAHLSETSHEDGLTLACRFPASSLSSSAADEAPASRHRAAQSPTMTSVQNASRHGMHVAECQASAASLCPLEVGILISWLVFLTSCVKAPGSMMVFQDAHSGLSSRSFVVDGIFRRPERFGGAGISWHAGCHDRARGDD